MRARSYLVGSAVVGCLAVLSIGKLSFAEDKAFYEVFQTGDPITDQSAAPDKPVSNLVGHEGQVTDADFAANFAARAVAARASLYLVFNQCYSGGFIDDLARLGGTLSIMTAARHTETASYAYEPPRGVDVDSTDSFLQALGDGKLPAAAIAAESVARNPFGPNPNLKRIGESVGSEHAQYFASNGGAQLKIADHAAKGMAVLWAGGPAERDGKQMNQMVSQLLKMGFPADRVWLLYGGGTVTAKHPIARTHFAKKADPIHLKAATRENLAEAFEASFGEGVANPPEFVFMYVGDHGGLDARAVAKTGYKPDLEVAPNFTVRPGMVLFGGE